MTILTRFLLKNTAWSIGSYGFVQVIRLVTNIILARLLAPQIFGIMLIVNSLRIGIEFVSDVGVGQNIVFHSDANAPDFYNTAWTIQALRGIAVWLIATSLALPFAHFYHIPVLTLVIPLIAFTSVLAGFSSVGPALLQKRLQVAKLNAFDIFSALTGSIALVILAYLEPTIWSLVFGFIIGCIATTIGSYFLLPDIRLQFRLSKRYTSEILHFGKWIFLASIIYFLSTNFDRLYLAKVLTLQVIGVYGIARSIADMLSTMVQRLGNHVLFPFIASHSATPRFELRQQLILVRAQFLMAAGGGVSLLVATADLPIRVLYDARYQAAGWMLPLLIIGSWFSVLAYVNESTLLGLGKPLYGAVANGIKFAFLVIALPLSVMSFGLAGGIIVMVLADLFRYLPILVGLRREHFTFAKQDVIVTVITFMLIGLWEWLRWQFGLGTSFETLPGVIRSL
jgi:O-antigen/teichoic acid export membrane protein